MVVMSKVQAAKKSASRAAKAMEMRDFQIELHYPATSEGVKLAMIDAAALQALELTAELRCFSGSSPQLKNRTVVEVETHVLIVKNGATSGSFSIPYRVTKKLQSIDDDCSWRS